MVSWSLIVVASAVVLAGRRAVAHGSQASVDAGRLRGFFSGCGKYSDSCFGCINSKGTFNRKHCHFLYVSDDGESVKSKCVSSVTKKVKRELHRAASGGHLDVVEVDTMMDCPSSSSDGGSWTASDLENIRAHLIAHDPVLAHSHEYKDVEIGTEFHSNADFCQAVLRNDIDSYAEESGRTSSFSKPSGFDERVVLHDHALGMVADAVRHAEHARPWKNRRAFEEDDDAGLKAATTSGKAYKGLRTLLAPPSSGEFGVDQASIACFVASCFAGGEPKVTNDVVDAARDFRVIGTADCGVCDMAGLVHHGLNPDLDTAVKTYLTSSCGDLRGNSIGVEQQTFLKAFYELATGEGDADSVTDAAKEL